MCVCIVKCTPGHICIPQRVHCVDTVCDLSKCAWTTYVFMWVHKAGGIGTPNHVRAVTSRAEIGLVSPVIRRRGERGKKRKLEERKRLFHHQYFPLYLHLHNNFISNSRLWIQNRRAIPLWSQLKLIEYLYADCGTLNSLSFRIAPPPYALPFLLSLVLELPLLGFDTIFTPPRALYFHWLQLKGPVERLSEYEQRLVRCCYLHLAMAHRNRRKNILTPHAFKCQRKIQLN